MNYRNQSYLVDYDDDDDDDEHDVDDVSVADGHHCLLLLCDLGWYTGSMIHQWGRKVLDHRDKCYDCSG